MLRMQRLPVQLAQLAAVAALQALRQAKLISAVSQLYHSYSTAVSCSDSYYVAKLCFASYASLAAATHAKVRYARLQAYACYMQVLQAPVAERTYDGC